MKKQLYVSFMMVILLVAVSVLSTGCSSPGQTSKAVHRKHMDTWQNQVWQMQDDADAFLMIDRPSRLSPMYVR